VDPALNQSGGLGTWGSWFWVKASWHSKQIGGPKAAEKRKKRNKCGSGGAWVQAKNLLILIRMRLLMVHLPAPSVRAGRAKAQGHAAEITTK
jgi:hypothetical protein